MFTEFSREEPQDLRLRLESAALPSTIYELLCVTAKKHGDGQAWHFIDTGVSRTWNEVKSLVDQVAAALHSVGVGPGSHVAVMAWNIEEFPLTWLALARLGATMVPVNARYTASEVAYVLETGSVTHLIFDEEFLDTVLAVERTNIGDDKLIVVGTPNARFANWRDLLDVAHAAAPIADPQPDRLLNLQFTSGTTGFPKACMLSHRYWVVLGFTSVEMYGVKLQRFYASTSFFYMVPQRILVNTMFAGGTIFFPKRATAKRFMVDVARFDCDYCLPFQPLMTLPPSPDDKAHRVKIATSSIPSMTTGEHSRFQERFGFAIQNWYGMTEIGSGSYVPAHRVMEKLDSGTIGVPTPFREMAIFDLDGRRLPTGASGEICVKGPGMMQGYYRNEAATAESFRNGWFRTGDLGRMDEDGYFYIVGRLKDMVRRGGENVAAREVEAVIRMMPGVVESAVVPVPDPHAGEEVKAYVQLGDGLSPEIVTPQAILAHCAQHLAPFKVPRYIAYVPRFSLTESQRVQKRVLTDGVRDLRVGAYDRFLQTWH